MRSWHELSRALSDGGLLIDTDPEEQTAVLHTVMMLGVSPAYVPVSWGRSRMNPSGCLLATGLLRPGSGTWGPLTGRLLAEPWGVPASSEVFGEIVRAAFVDSLLRPLDPAPWKERAVRETRNEAIVTAGPRLLASLNEERERWAPIW